VEEHLLIDLAAVLVLGITGVWIAWRLNLPSILVLLALGFMVGPLTGFMNTDEVFGELLLPLVSLSVGIILFEGGLSLKLHELEEIGRPLLNLVTWGAALTWGLTSLGAHFLGGLDVRLSILLGAILVVTGPTVIAPLLRDIRPSGRVANLLKWEGIVIDPVGAVLAVLTFEVIFATEGASSLLVAIEVILLTILIGGGLGLLGGAIVYQALRRYWIPDYLHNPFSLMMVVAVFVAANLLQPESGLLATTIMGVALANQNQVTIKKLAEFKEDLQVLLISSLFILLTSRLPLDIVNEFRHISTLVFLVLLLLVVRPAAVWLSTLRSKLDWKERLFVSWMAPRGIVAAAVSAIFAIRLTEAGHAGADRLANLTFVAIAGTVTIYGLTAPVLARRLGLSSPDPQGFLLIGGHSWGRRIATALRKFDVRVLVMDSNYDHIRQARMDGLEVTYGSALSASALEDLDLSGIGKLLALTANDEVNSLASLHFRELFGIGGVFQVAPPDIQRDDKRERVANELRGRIVSSEDRTYQYYDDMFDQAGTEVKLTLLTDTFSYADFKQEHEGNVVPLFLKRPSGEVRVCAVDDPLEPQAGDRVISIVPNLEPLKRFT
jgi:NhaP-type Na+/H+ or K+/H+ antiporter/Trk K+ transport system NAD-binding subunit